MRKTCPDRQMLSVYLDGELPSPWKEKLESHVSQCPECARRIEAYRGISRSRAGVEESAVSDAGERVWRRLGASPGRGGRRSRAGAIWRRSVSMPMTAAAAAAALAVGLAFAWAPWGGGDSDVLAAQGVSFVSDTDLYVSAQNMESVIEYLLGRGGSDTLVISLPEHRSFVSSGEPAIVRAADYSRQLASWGAQGRGRD